MVASITRSTSSRSTCRVRIQLSRARPNFSGTPILCSLDDGCCHAGSFRPGDMMPFLEHRDGRPLTIEAPDGFRPREFHLGLGAMALEVAVLDGPRKPTNPELRDLHA